MFALCILVSNSCLIMKILKADHLDYERGGRHHQKYQRNDLNQTIWWILKTPFVSGYAKIYKKTDWNRALKIWLFKQSDWNFIMITPGRCLQNVENWKALNQVKSFTSCLCFPSNSLVDKVMLKMHYSTLFKKKIGKEMDKKKYDGSFRVHKFSIVRNKLFSWQLQERHILY